MLKGLHEFLVHNHRNALKTVTNSYPALDLAISCLNQWLSARAIMIRQTPTTRQFISVRKIKSTFTPQSHFNRVAETRLCMLQTTCATQRPLPLKSLVSAKSSICLRVAVAA